MLRRVALVLLVLWSVPLSAQAPPAGPNTPPRQLCDGSIDVAARLAKMPPAQRAEVEAELNEVCQYALMPTTPTHDTADPDPDATHKHWLYKARFSPDGKWIASASLDKTVKLWDAATGKLVRTLATTAQSQPKPNTGWFRDVAFLPDGQRVAVAADGEPVRVVDLATGNLAKTLGARTSKDESPFALHLAVSSRGLLFVTNDEGGLDAWDTALLAVKYSLPKMTGKIRAIGVSDSTNVLATSNDRNDGPRTIYLWRLDNGERIAEISGGTPNSDVDALSFSADGKRLAAAVGGTAKVWSVDDRKLVREIQLHRMFSIFDLKITRDGKRLMTCRTHPQLWDIESGKLIRHFGPFTDLCHSVELSPDERYAVTTSMGSDVRQWDLEAGVFHRRFGRNVTPRY